MRSLTALRLGLESTKRGDQFRGTTGLEELAVGLMSVTPHQKIPCTHHPPHLS